MEIITRNEKILYIGIDVHKDIYSLCCFDFQKNELSDEMTIRTTTKAVIKYLEAIKKKHKEEILFICGYEDKANRLRSLPRITKGWLWLRVIAPITMSNPDVKTKVKKTELMQGQLREFLHKFNGDRP